MIHLRFHGAIIADLGADHLDASVSTPMDAMKLLECNKRGILNKWFRKGHYIILVNGVPVNQKTMGNDLFDDDVVDFVPVVCGNELFTIIFAIIAVVLAVAAIILALTAIPKDDMDKDSKSYQGDVNVSKEGVIVPVIWGTTRVGTVVVSSDRIVGTNQTTVPRMDPRGRYGNYDGTPLPDTSVPSQTLISSDRMTTQIVHVLGEGQIVGLVNGDEDVLFDGTQLKTGATYNFAGVVTDFRDGYDPQVGLNMIQRSTTPVSVASDLTTSNITRTLSSDLDYVRLTFKVTSFYTTVDNKIVGTSENIIIEKSPTGAGTWTTVSSPVIAGEYFAERFFQISLPLDNAVQYDIRVRRVSPEIATDKTQDGIHWESLAEIKNDRVTYDGTALLGITYTNDSFGGSNPVTEAIVAGRIIDIPSNYNPVTRVYTGLWNGLFTTGFTDNPFYIALDAINNKKFGLGSYGVGFDKFTAYNLGVFSDVLVDDGNGGTEPRFTVNGSFRDSVKAVKVLSDILSTARAQYTWDGGQLSFFMEEDKAPVAIATNANVIDGNFKYQGASAVSKKNSVYVTYLDKTNQYIKSVVGYRDHESIRDNGLNESEFEGVATTSRGQALRMAKYSVLTDGRAVEFTGTEEFAKKLPGDLIEVYDENVMAARYGGRVMAATTSAITLDAPFVIAGGRTYEISAILPDGTYEKRTVTNAVGTHTVITVSAVFSLAPQLHAIWGITVDNLAPQQFIIQSRTAVGGGYKISALSYDPNKLTQVETGIAIDANINTVLPVQHYIAPVTGVTFSKSVFQESNGFRQDLTIEWVAPTSSDEILGYDVYYEYESQPRKLIEIGSIDRKAILPRALIGVYEISVYARTVYAISDPAYTVYNMVAPNPDLKNVGGLELFGQANNNVFENRDAKFVWRNHSDFQVEEIGSEETYGVDAVLADDTFKDFSIVVIDSATSNVIREESGIIVNEYTYTLEKNIEDGGPYRDFIFGVARNSIYNTSSGSSYIQVNNPPPPIPSNIVVVGTIGGIVVSYDPSITLVDFAGVLIWASATQGFTPSDANLVSDATQADTYINITSFVPMYVRIAQYDTYGKTGLNISDEYAASPLNADVTSENTSENTLNVGTSTADVLLQDVIDAQADADAAIADISDIASDSLLTPDEKPRVIQDRDALVAEQSGIDAQATTLAITTEKTTYDAAVTALTVYLATLTTPTLWSDLAGNTTIVGATFRTKFLDVYAARQALLDKVALVSSSLAAGANNLLGSDAGPEQIYTAAYVYKLLALLSDYGLAAGEFLSPTMEVKTDGTAGSAARFILAFYNGADVFISQLSVQGTTASTAYEIINGSVEIPATAVKFSFYSYWIGSSTSTKYAKGAMLSRGPVPVPYVDRVIEGQGDLATSVNIPSTFNMDQGGGVLRTIPRGILTGTAYDASAITFTRNYANAPLVIYLTGGKTTHSTLTGDVYQAFTSTSLTASGFTPSLLLRETVGTITEVNTTNAAVVGPSFDFELNNDSGGTIAWDDSYDYQIDLSINTIPVFDPIDKVIDYIPGWVDVNFYVWTAAGWTQAGSAARIYGFGGSSSPDVISNRVVTKVGVGLLARTGGEFAVDVIATANGGSITSFDKVTFGTATAPAEAVATVDTGGVKFMVIEGEE